MRVKMIKMIAKEKKNFGRDEEGDILKRANTKTPF